MWHVRQQIRKKYFLKNRYSQRFKTLENLALYGIRLIVTSIAGMLMDVYSNVFHIALQKLFVPLHFLLKTANWYYKIKYF